MGITEDIINPVQAPKTTIVVAVSRKRRVQLEYKLMTSIPGMFVTRTRNGTKYEMANGSVIIVQISGPATPDVDTTDAKAKAWKAWLADDEKEEKADKTSKSQE